MDSDKYFLRKHQPSRFRFEITSSCSFMCQHCYVSEETWGLSNMSLSEVKQVINKITKVLPVKILFLGGEPFERKDFFEILEYAKQRGATLGIDTNAWFLDAHKIKEIKKIGVASINITTYGCTEEINDSFTRPGHFNHIIEILNIAKKENVNIDFALLITKNNFCELFKINKFAEKFGIKKVHIDVFLADKNFKYRRKYQLNTFQFLIFWGFIRLFLQYATSRIYSKPKYENRPGINVSFCDQNSFPLIKSNGDFWPCLFYAKSIGNVLNDDPKTLWKKFYYFTFDEKYCSRCIEKKLDGLGQKIMSSNKNLSRIFMKLHRVYIKIVQCF